MKTRIAITAAIVLSICSAASQAQPDSAHFAQKLNAIRDWSNPTSHIGLCLHVGPNDVRSDVKDHCRDAFEAAARANLGDPARARGYLEQATKMGLPDDKRAAIDAPLRKTEAAAKVQAAKEAKEAKVRAAKAKNESDKRMSTARIEYGEALRQKYLDDGLDIKVLVSGTANTRITLKFALFNDVWANKMRKGDLINEMETVGFKRLTMTDGYDYTVYWDLNK